MTILLDREVTLSPPVHDESVAVYAPPAPRRGGGRAVLAAVVAVSLAAVSGAAYLLTRPPTPRADAVRWELAATAEILGVPAERLTGASVSDVEAPTGVRRQVVVPDRALLQFDALTREMNQVVFSDRLDGTSGPLLAREEALAVASAYASGHYAGFDSLVRRSVRVLDHDAFTEYRVEWQERSGEAWLPNGVSVGVNARTGTVAYYWSARTALTTSVTARVSATDATRAARRLAPHAQSLTVPELSVVLAGDGQQQLVWVVVATPPHGKGAHVAVIEHIWVDALTGIARVGAST